MSIIISCACGESYPIKEQFAGQRVQCPKCQRILTVPGPAVTVVTFPTPRPSAAPVSEPVIDLPLLTPTHQPPPIRARHAEAIVELPLDDFDARLPPRSSAAPLIILAIVLVMLLGGSGAALFFLLREEGSHGPPVAANDRGQERDRRQEEKEPGDKQAAPRNPVPNVPVKKEPVPVPLVTPLPAVTTGPWQGHGARILRVGFALNGRFAISASGGAVLRDGMKVPATDTTIRLWEPTTGKELKRLDGFTHGLATVAFDPAGTRAVVADITEARTEASAGPDAFDLHVWSLTDKRELRALKGHERGVLCAAFTPDGRRLLSGGRDARLRIWDVDAGTQISEFVHPGYINDVAISNDGRIAATACSDRSVRVFDLLDKKVLQVLAGHQDIVWAVAVSPDGKIVASGGGGDYDGIRGEFVPGSRDYEIRLWDVASGKELHRLRGHTDAVRTLAFSADGRRLLSGGYDKTVRLWHVASGRELGRFSEHTDWVQSVAFFPDGRRALSGGYDKTLRVWTLPPDVGDLAKRLQGMGADRLETLREIAIYGSEARVAVPALLALVRDADPSIKQAALATLNKVGAVSSDQVELLVPLLKDAGFPEGRAFAINALTLLGRDARPALPAVLALLKDTNPALRLKAIAIIAAIGADARATAFTPLMEMLRDPDMEVARAVPDALTKLGKPTKDQLPILTSFLADKAEPVRRYAVLGITDLGDEAAPALPALRTVLEKDTSATLRLLALTALLKIQTDGKALIEPLTRALTDDDSKVVVKAAEALAAFPPETGVLPSLLKALQHADPAVVKIADDALEKFPFTKQNVPFINESLQNKNAAVRLRMLKTVTKLGADAADTVPGLIAVVKTSSGEMRMTAVNALADLGPAAKDAGPALAALLKGSDNKTRLALCIVLGKIEADETKQALPFLVGLLKVENLTDEEAKTNRETAFKTLVQIGEPAVDDLLKAVAHDFAGGNLNTPMGVINAEARLATLQTLAEIGKKSKLPIRRALLTLVKVQREDSVPQVQAAARQAFIALQK